MLELQEKLNFEAFGMARDAKVTKEGKVVNWKRCIYMECAELIDSFSWKHWKDINGGIDRANIEMEMVDIWHFLMSYLLSQKEKRSLVVLLSGAVEETSDVRLPKTWKPEDNKKIDAYLDEFENLMALALINNDSDEFIEHISEQFFICCSVVGLSLERLYRVYLTKNVLNKFRQEHGYKEGNYIKVWDGKEDNVVALEILQNEPDLDFEALYQALKSFYPK
jgi:dimeric dUTPase (all-alpha-NTP-PPase superfamily)